MVRCRAVINGALLFAALGATKAAFANAGSESVDSPGLRGGAARTAAVPAAAPSASPSAAELSSARRLFIVALSAEDQGRWADALETYERVGKVAASPSLWYHRGVCHAELGHLVEAINAFDLALSGATERREVALARESRSRLEQLRARTAQVVLDVPADAVDVRIEIDGVPLNPALAGAAVIVEPGDRRVVVRARNYPEVFDTTVRVVGGGVVEMRADLGDRRPRAAPRPRPPWSSSSVSGPVKPAPSLMPAFLVGGTALALAAGAVVTGVVAYDVRERFLQQNANPTSSSLAERRSLHTQGEVFAITSTALTGGALLAGGLATYLFWPSSSADRRPTRSAAALPWIGPDGAGLLLQGAL